MALKTARNKTGGMDVFQKELEKKMPQADALAPAKSGGETKALLIRIPAELHTKLKMEAVSKGYSMRVIVEDMIAARYN